ncbi:cadherin-like domain-containing protein [Shewanella gaetbuli]|uniref:cadherin-like domain-containing protein n=1 Tax=Shewanella gaetbuli TaxID=220752 RepID=UPI003B83732A
MASPLTDTVTEDNLNVHQINLLDGATDVDGDQLIISNIAYQVDGGVKGATAPLGMSLGADGHSILVDATGKGFQHIAVGVTENITVSYTISDGHGGSVQQTATIAVTGTNDAPVVSSEVQLASGTEDTNITLTKAALLANATDIDDNDAGHLDIANLVADHGTIVTNQDGTFTFSPDKDYNGQVHFTYDVVDGNGGVSHTGASTSLAAVGDAAVITEATTSSVTEDGSNSSHYNGYFYELASGLLNVVDPDSGDNRFSFSTYGETAIHDPFGGILHIDSLGIWRYKVSNSALQYLAEGQTEVVSYRVHSYDGTEYQLNINVVGKNDAPTVSHVTLTNGAEDTIYQMHANQFGFTDVDSGDTLHSVTLTQIPLASEGKFILDGHEVTVNQVIDVADISKLQFVPVKDFNGDVHFSYTVNDGHTDSAPASSTLNIAPVNDITVVTSTQSQTTEDIAGGQLITKAQLLAGATDIDGDTLDISAVHVDASEGTITDNHNGTWTFNPTHDFKGNATLNYKVTDGTAEVDNHMTVTVSPVTDTAQIQLNIKTEQNVMTFAKNDAGAVTNNGHLQTNGDITNLAVEFNVIGGPSAPPAGHNGPTFVSYATSHSDNEFYVWNPTNLTIRVGGHEYQTGVSATDGLTHRYSVLWSSSTGHLELLVDGTSKWINPTPAAKGYHIPGNGVLAVGNDQDNYALETGSRINHGYSVSDAFSGEMFSATLANAAVTAKQLEHAPLASVLDKDNGLVIDMRMDAQGHFFDTTGHHQITPTANIHSTSTLVDTSVAIPNADALIHLNLQVSAPSDGDDVITNTLINGLLKGTVLADGHGHSHTVTSMTENVNVNHWNLATLTAQLPGNNTDNINLGILVATQGPDGTTAINSHYQNIILDPTKPVPNAMITGDLTGSTDEVTEITGQLQVTDPDANQAHFIADVLPSTHGEFVITADGHWHYTPNQVAQTLNHGQNATDIVTVTTSDGTKQQISVTLIGSDTAPTTVTTDLGKIETDGSKTIQASDLLNNVTDIDTSAANLSIVSGSLNSAHGTITSNPDGSFTFVPNAGFIGKDIDINFKVTDGHNDVDAKAIIDINPPLAITKLGNDTGVSDHDFITSDGHLVVYGTGEPGAKIIGLGVLSATNTTVDEHGNWKLDVSGIDRADGTYLLKIAEQSAGGGFKMVQHSVTIDTAKPTITINPISSDDWINNQDHQQDLVIAGSTSHIMDGVHVDVVVAGAHYTATVNNNQWQLTIPAGDVSQITDNNYQVHAEVRSTATGDLASNERHLVVSADMTTLTQTHQVKEDSVTNASGSLFASGASYTVMNTGSMQGNYGDLTINPDGTYNYSLHNQASEIQQMTQGEVHGDNFLVSYTNNHGDIKHAVVNIGIHGTNDAPVLTGTFELSRSITTGFITHAKADGYIDIHDVDTGDALTVEYIDSDGDHHLLDFSPGKSNTIDVHGIGHFSIGSDGHWDFVFSKSGVERDMLNQEVNAGKIHTESITLVVTDSAGESRQEDLTIHIGKGQSGAVIFGSSESVVNEDRVGHSHGSLDLLVGDVRVASGLTWEVQPHSGPQYGDLTFKPDGSWEYQSHNNDPRVQALADGERLEEIIKVTATDSNGHTADQEMKLVIIGTNDVPVVGHMISETVAEDHLLTLTKAQLLANVTDADSKDVLDVSQLSLDGNATITQQGDHWIINPGVNFNGELHLHYTVSDGHVDVDNQMFIHVSPEADKPTLIFTKHVNDLSSPLDNFAIHGNENTPLALNINVASPDANESLTVEISGLPQGAQLSAGTEHNGVWTLQQHELTNLKVTPAQDFHGQFDIDVKAISHDGSSTASISHSITVDVIPTTASDAALSSQNDEPDSVVDSIIDVETVDVDVDVLSASVGLTDAASPVDHYLHMVGLTHEDITPQAEIPAMAGLPTMHELSSSDPMADMLDTQQVDVFDNPLDDEKQHQHHEVDQHQSDDNALENHDVNQQNDDDLLHQALNDMHNQI